MASSTTYWKFTESVKDRASALSEEAKAIYETLENGDDELSTLADMLLHLREGLDNLASTVGEAIVPLREADKALEDMPKGA
jgi:hypothetical protein